MSNAMRSGNVALRLARVAERQGLDVSSLLRRAGIAADSAGRPVAEVTGEQLSELTQEMWILTEDELMNLGPPLPRGSFQLVMRSLIHVPDLRSALQRLVEASTVLTGMPNVSVMVGDDRVDLGIDVGELDDPDHLGAELTAAAIHRTLGWLVGRRLPLLALDLPWPPSEYAADYEIVFGRHPDFDAPRLVMAFDSRLLTAPLVRDEQDLTDYLSDQPNVWFSTRDFGSTTADQVRMILQRGLSGHWPTPDDIAAQLRVSTQHLRRLLRDEHTSIGQTKEELLRDAAIASLSRGEESVEDLARRLGFSEASAFRRAFRRWTGRPPGSYRTPEGPRGSATGA
ncbi:AraC family transcriptional regulator ligand-binding domain-containing protein [Streptomyces sp. NPDC057245]|uniref:AraC family transcriptional regulator n=1 Tax=Streptomyces sp. NPDC057245 TaxID=3346065 RepID=UPI003639DCDE